MPISTRLNACQHFLKRKTSCQKIDYINLQSPADPATTFIQLFNRRLVSAPCSIDGLLQPPSNTQEFLTNIDYSNFADYFYQLWVASSPSLPLVSVIEVKIAEQCNLVFYMMRYFWTNWFFFPSQCCRAEGQHSRQDRQCQGHRGQQIYEEDC
jgi:hypothetical protein